MDTDTELPVVCEAPTRYMAMNGNPFKEQSGDRLPYMNREYLTFDENNKPHPKAQELFYEALKTGPLFYSDLQAKVQTLLNCSTQMWNNMFCQMRDTGGIIRIKNKDGKYVWQLPGTGDSPSS